VSQLGTRRKVKGVYDDYKKFLKANVAMLREQGIEPPEDREDLPDAVRQELDLSDDELEMFDQWNKVISTIKEESLDEVNEKDLYDLKDRTREFVSKVGEDLKERKAEADDMTPEMDTSEIAEAADTQEMVPNLEEKAEQEIQEEDEEESEEQQ
jgi:hypothetical protein